MSRMQTVSGTSCSRPLAVVPVCSTAPVQITAQPRRRQRLQPVCSAGKQQSTVSSCTDRQQAATASTAFAAAAGLISPLLLDVHSASAHDPLLQGKIVSLVHPATMFFLFGATAWTGWLGLQWRRLRTIPAAVKDLKSQLPAPDKEGQRPHSPIEDDIKQLEKERKELAGKDVKGVHHNWGSLLLGLGVLIAVVGPVNTYLRLGKLFPGPHLYAGAGIVVLWALAASMVPFMAKGNDAARTLHITLNCLNLALFAWQIPTGLEIVGKVLQFAPWP